MPMQISNCPLQFLYYNLQTHLLVLRVTEEITDPKWGLQEPQYATSEPEAKGYPGAHSCLKFGNLALDLWVWCCLKVVWEK